jgi:5S rRNA maturation endonuclease (ribonuclease M5)
MTHYASLEDALINGRGTERSFLCHVHGDTNPSASVNAVTGLWYCYACHAKGKVDLNDIDLDPYAIRRRISSIIERIETGEVIYPENWLNIFDATGPGDYWLSRFSEQICREHRLGTTPDGLYATIPLRDNDGTVKGVIKRSLTGQLPKYHYPYQAKLSQRLYNYHRADKDMVVLTEGATDAIAFDEVAPGYSMAIYGSSLSRAQVRLILRYAPRLIVVATDQDTSGRIAYQQIRGALGQFYPVIRLTWDTHKDLASIPLEERREMIGWLLAEYGLPSRVG